MPNSYILLVSRLSVASHSNGHKRKSGHLHNAVLRKLKLGTAFGFKSAEQSTGAMGGPRPRRRCSRLRPPKLQLWNQRPPRSPPLWLCQPRPPLWLCRPPPQRRRQPTCPLPLWSQLPPLALRIARRRLAPARRSRRRAASGRPGVHRPRAQRQMVLAVPALAPDPTIPVVARLQLPRTLRHPLRQPPPPPRLQAVRPPNPMAL